MTPHIFGHGYAGTARDVVTAAVLAGLTEEEIAKALEQLADYTADHITDRLRGSLEDVREERRGG